MSDKKSKYSKSSASGERRLVSGISNQYKIIGELTLKNLRKLKGIKLVDDDAGQLDDFQICMGNKIDSYQIKWSKIPGPISFSNITKEIENRSLIKDVATSWKNIREKYPSKKVIAHILTNDYASLGDKVIKDKELAKNQKKPKRNNFASFIEECWKHFKKSGEIKKEWEIGWNNLQNASGLNENEFKDFVFNCELDLMYKQFESDNSIKKNKKEENINHISEKLRECVAKSFETVKLDKDTLLELLNWSKFNEYKNKHEFPVDELYQPIQSNVNQLKNCLDNVSNGYIYVFGTPGSGKSSFLSDFLKGIDERVIYYYNYIPHETTSFLKRGEAENFFHDIINAIRDEGFDNSEILDDNVNQLGKQFLDHINLLYKDWEENNNRTIFLIDGIDHIEREQNPISSLLDYLPPSSDIPEGIIFIFGSQTEKALPPKIRSSYNKINMDPLNKDELFKVIEKKKSLNLSKRQKNRIFSLSEGHTLALSYLLNKLERKNNLEIEEVLNNTLQYKGDIEYQYTALWESIDDNLKNLIGKICRFRDGYVDIVWIKKWANPTIFSIFQDKLGHFFKKYGYNWYFFHDSFKIFIQEKTIMEWDGTINSMLSLEFHKDIADECQNSLPNSYWYWEEIYHRFNANEHEKVLKIATQSYFRNQLFNFRPINDIKIDIYFALKSAKMYSDSVALARLILIHMEIQEREHNLENELLISSLFKLKRFKEGLNYIHCKNQLKIDYIDVFKLIPHILNQGLYEEAKNIFNMAEPLNMIYYSDIIILDHQNKKEKLLQEWANVVIFFRNLDDILEIIDNMRNIKALFNPFKKQSDAIARNFRNKLFWNVLLSLSDDYEKNEILKIIAKFDSNNSFDYFINSRLKVIFNSYKKGKLDFAKYVLNETLNIIDEKQITPCPVLSAKISYFSYLVLNDIEKAENILKNIPNPYVIDLSKIIHLNTNLFLGIFEINRSWNLVFDEFPEIDFKYANESKEAIDKLKYLIDCFSFISTQILKNNKISEEEIINKFKCIIDYYYLVQNNSKASLPNSHRWYKFKDILNEFIIIFINIVKKDPFYVSLLQNILKREWNSKFLSWDNNLIREIILNIYNDDNKEWTIEQLNLIEAERDFNTNIYKGVEEFIQQAEAYYLLDEEGRLLKNFQTAIDRSFGIYPEKDYQLSTWIKWLNEYIIQYPFQTKNLVKNFAGKILALDENTDRRVISDAASQLLSTTLDWSPWNSLILSKFFFCHSLIYYEDVIENFLFKTLKNSDSSIRLVFLMTTYILLPISDHPPNNLINLLFDKINEIYGRNKVIDSGKFMVTKIKTIINRSKRPSFLKSISNAILNKNIDLIEINITKSDIYEKKNNQYNALELKDSTYLSETEVKEKLSSIKNFETLFGFEKENSYFHWEDVLEDFMKNLDENDKLRIIEIYKNKYKNLKKSRSLFVLTLFSDMTYEFDRDFSKKLAEEAFELSDKFGWSSRFDGGSRLASFKSLMKFDKKKTRNLLFDTFIEDVIAFKNVSVNLKEIISLVSDEIPIETIWPEINEHLTYLLKYNNTKTEGLEFKEISDDSHVKSLNHLLLYNLANPIAMISENSQKIIIDLLINNNEDIKNCINDFLNKKEFFQEKIVIILESVYIKNPKIVKEFHETLQSLKKSSNYVIRKTATILCKKIGD